MVDANTDLKAVLEVNQSNASKDLFAEFRVYPHFSGNPRNLFAKLFVGVDASKDLYATFTTQATENLKAEFIVRHTATKDLFTEFRVYIFFGEGKANLKAVMLVTQPGSADLKTVATIRNAGDENLKAVFMIRQLVGIDLFAEAVIRHSASTDLAAEFIVRHSATADLNAMTVIRHTGVPIDLKAVLEVEPVADLFADFIVRHSSTADLKTTFYVRHPYWLWTTRRYINGVVDAAERLIGDAKLEDTIEGVMEDIQGLMEANSLAGTYEAWTNITLVPVLIRRATTYGTVAALYARHSKTFKSRVIPTVAPVTVTTLGDDERAMQYWQDKMDAAIANYFSIQSVPVVWVSTADEEPVFTMADIPVSEWNPSDDLLEWHTWLNQRNS